MADIKNESIQEKIPVVNGSRLIYPHKKGHDPWRKWRC